MDITHRLHNTALQRVDRCASAHITLAHVGFLDSGVVGFALSIPAAFKICDGVEKWILRKAMLGDLLKRVLLCNKSKFWGGAGVENLFERYAEIEIEDSEFCRERILPNGWVLRSKEKLLYYRIFKKFFGGFPNLSWIG